MARAYVLWDELKSGDAFTEIYEDRDEAIDKADAAWDHLSDYDKNRRRYFYVGLYELDEDGQPDGDPMEVVWSAFRWYAVMTSPDDDDWGTGSYDYDEAVKMVRPYLEDGGYIAVIEEDVNPVCIEEIRDFDEEEKQ